MKNPWEMSIDELQAELAATNKELREQHAEIEAIRAGFGEGDRLDHANEVLEEIREWQIYLRRQLEKKGGLDF